MIASMAGSAATISSTRPNSSALTPAVVSTGLVTAAPVPGSIAASASCVAGASGGTSRP